MDTLLTGKTPEGIIYELHPAGFLARFTALQLDTCFQGIVLLAGNIILSLFTDILGGWITLIYLFLVQWFYHITCEIFFQGQSLGKRIMNLQVVMRDGTPVQPGASFLRNILRGGDAFFLLYHIGFFSHILSPGFRRLGDWAAGTLVVYHEQKMRIPGRSSRQWLQNRPPAETSRPLTGEEKRILLRFCERYPRLGKIRAQEIARPLAERFSDEEKAREFPADYLLSLGAPLLGMGDHS